MPVLLIPIVMWVMDFLKQRAFGLTMVGVFVGMIAAYLAALTALMALINSNMPSFVADAMAVVLPSQWPLQIATVASIYSLGIAYRVGLQSVVIFSKS
ncbi:hypothetical protein [Chromobacterium violaceum]|uniref:hypothetical protein n=1 Tax=Chromobacterium violaceum TaxID=536 RepID=UPI001950F151|nr:hypothetical protein [Chromobacterium violaceum]QRO33898.1 hypothetical protein I6K04_03920 [Chromobacterium violaceum]QRQ16298.1 hypothetical protein I6K03_18810 [Chromobacterium violaceum]